MFLFEYYNSRHLHEHDYSGIDFDIEDKQLQQKVLRTLDCFALFGIRVNKITDYKSFIKRDYDFGFQIQQDEDYIIEINIITDYSDYSDYYGHHIDHSDEDRFNFRCKYNHTNGIEYISREIKTTTLVFKKKIEINFKKGATFKIYPIFRYGRYTIEPESYVRCYLVN